LHSAIGYVTPQEMLAGRQAQIHADRDRKLEQARRQRQLRRQQAPPSMFARFRYEGKMSTGETEAGWLSTAGTQPMLRDSLTGLIGPIFGSVGAYPLAFCTDRKKSSDDRPQHALKITARQGGVYTLTENVTSPFHAEPRQTTVDKRHT
jgi:hypothetical protein